MNLETIKNQYAIEQGYENWYDLYRFHITTSDDRLEYHFNIIIKLIQDELKKKIARESRVLVKGILITERKTLFTLFDKGAKGVVKRKVTVDKQQILNTENIK